MLTTGFGVLVGVAFGWIAAVNFAMFAGVDLGYEATVAQIYAESPLTAVGYVALLVAGPVVMGWMAHKYWN